jgi:hypothetical protein
VRHEDPAHPKLSGNGRPRISRLQRPPGGHRGRLPIAAGVHIPAAIPPDLLCRGNGLLCGCTLAHRRGREEFLRSGCFGCWRDGVLGGLRYVAGPALRFALDRQNPATALARTRRSPDRDHPASGTYRLCFAVDCLRLSFSGLVLGRLRLSLAGCGLIVAYPKVGFLGLTTMALVANILHPGDRQPPPDWQAVDTHLGAISHGPVSPLREYLAAQDIQALAVASSARIVVFPESVVPRWTMSTDLFWKPTIDTLRQNGKVVVIGALIPESLPLSNDDIHAAIDLLRTGARSAADPPPGGTLLLPERGDYSRDPIRHLLPAGARAGFGVETVFAWRRSAAFGRAGSAGVRWRAGGLADLLRASHPLDGVDRRSGAPHTFRGDVQRSLGYWDAHPAMAGALSSRLESPV